MIDKSARMYIAGHRGLVGSAIWRRLEADGYSDLIGRTSRELDLRDREAVFTFFRAEHPQQVVHAAAKVGGILALRGWAWSWASGPGSEGLVALG